MPYKKILYTIHCPRCDKDYTVQPQAYFRKMKDEKYGKYCTSCRAKIQWEEMTPEEKKTMKEKSTNATKKKYKQLSDADKLKMIEKRKAGVTNYWNGLTVDQRKKISEKRSKDRVVVINNLSDEDMRSIGEKISKTKFLMNSQLTSEELYQRKLQKQQERKEYWSSLSDADKERIKSILRDNTEKYIVNMSDEEREKRSKTQTERNREFWDNAKADIISERIEKLIKNGEVFKQNLTIDEKKILIYKRLSAASGKNKFHQKIESMFMNSILSQSYYIISETVLSNNNVIHSWDYGIYDKETNTLQMVIDLDGSYYHADNCDYDGLHSKEEYDERRSISIPDGIKYSIIYESNVKSSFEDMMRSLMIDYDEFVNEQFRLYRSIDFPFPQYTDAELIKSYSSLERMDCNSKYMSLSINTRIGDRLIQHFHPSIYHAHRYKCLSPYDAWYDDEILMKTIINRTVYQSILNPNKILQGFNISKVAPKVSVFSAGRAKILINRYLSDVNEIFDPFSGFSGRMLGAISLGKQYIGQDISEIHVTESNNIVKLFQDHHKNVNASVDIENILDSHGEYESLFTCPPYGNKEQWYGVPIDNRSCDDWIDECLSLFKCKRYLFVVDTTIRYKDHIVDIVNNKSHFGGSDEYVVLF